MTGSGLREPLTGEKKVDSQEDRPTEANDDNFQQVTPDEPAQPVVEKLTTNRTKAIIFQNIYCIFQVGYLASMKHAVIALKVNPLDQVIYRNCLSGLIAIIVALLSG
jgi:hypothetical protein